MEVRRKPMRHMYLRIDPTDGHAVISCPAPTTQREIHGFVKAKYAWIKEKQVQVSASPHAQAAAATDQERAEWKRKVSASVPPLVAKWEPIMGVKVKRLTYRDMKTRWGTCQPTTGRVCINTRLALYPSECLEYVVVHELCHLRVSGHGPEFKALMDGYLPGWRRVRALLK